MELFKLKDFSLFYDICSVFKKLQESIFFFRLKQNSGVVSHVSVQDFEIFCSSTFIYDLKETPKIQNPRDEVFILLLVGFFTLSESS